MTFNRYIFLRMIVEFIGVCCCTIQLFIGNTLVGLTVAGVVALLWVVGEIWVVMVLNRQSPRRDELSDEHQRQAMQFTFQLTLGLLVIVGIVIMMVSLLAHTPVYLPAIILPDIAMAALVISDSRYLWLERSGMGESDED